MYSTCLFCHKSLGKNEVVEHLPIGRRLAFDSKLGRLWVVCRHCARWNLTPFEARWEALEECEEQFQKTPLRFSTENIGIARVSEGLELIRIGRPSHAEFAGWRYGEEFIRRNRRMYLAVAVGTAIPAGILVGALTGTLALGAGATLLSQVHILARVRSRFRTVALVPTQNGRAIAVRGSQVERTKLRLANDGDFTIEIPRRGTPIRVKRPLADTMIVKLLAHLNMLGASRKNVRAATIDLQSIGSGERYLSHAASVQSRLSMMPGHTRLALEMATHELAERRTLEGELGELEAAWREAEEIAGIADRL